jgi:DNA-binding NtrC family response regulator
VWLQAHLQARNGAGPLVQVVQVVQVAQSAPVSAPEQEASALSTTSARTSARPPARALSRPTAQTLRDNDRRVVEQTVRECGGNISKAARMLGVSRGLVYRHLKGTPQPGG